MLFLNLLSYSVVQALVGGGLHSCMHSVIQLIRALISSVQLPGHVSTGHACIPSVGRSACVCASVCLCVCVFVFKEGRLSVGQS